MKKQALALMAAASVIENGFYANQFSGLRYYPLPNPKNSNAARQKREAKKRANIRARSKK